MLPHPVGVAVAPALPLSPVETGLNRLDFTCVVLDVEGRGPDIGVGVFLEPLHLASEALVERESGATRADTVQGADTGPGVGRPELSQHGIMIGCGGAAPLCLPGHGRTVGPALGAVRGICTAPGAAMRLPGRTHRPPAAVALPSDHEPSRYGHPACPVRSPSPVICRDLPGVRLRKRHRSAGEEGWVR